MINVMCRAPCGRCCGIEGLYHCVVRTSSHLLAIRICSRDPLLRAINQHIGMETRNAHSVTAASEDHARCAAKRLADSITTVPHRSFRARAYNKKTIESRILTSFFKPRPDLSLCLVLDGRGFHPLGGPSRKLPGIGPRLADV